MATARCRKLGSPISGRTSRADPGRTAASAAGSVLSTEIAEQLGVPGASGFIRGILGGLLR